MSTEHKLFRQMLELELAAAKSLHNVLEDEYNSLKASDIKQLQQINKSKIERLKNLQELSQARCEWMQKMNIELSPSCIEHPLIKHSEPSQQQALDQLWQQLAAQFEVNSKITEVLSLVVLQARKRTQNLLHLLKGQKSNQGLYNKRGREQSRSDSNGYISA